MSNTINQAMIDNIKNLIGDQDEVNLEWLKTVTQLPLPQLSQIIIKHLGMVVLEGTVYSKIKAERKLKQMQEEAQASADRETFRKGPVRIDMMLLREKLWTVMLPEKILGQERHQFCPIWTFLENDEMSSIVLRYDWIVRLEKAMKNKAFNKLRVLKAETILNEMGEEFSGKAKAIFARTYPRDSFYDKNKPVWIMFLVNIIESGVQVIGLSMINVLTISSKFRLREKAYDALNYYLELINFLVNDTSIFEEVIIVQ
ncbi:MAG: hypothetical protein FK731_08445 [Asgard group archaeon]|nr:hypothetical protein [Asgard group archaeon]